MSQKRQEREENTFLDDKRLRKSRSFRSVVQEVIYLIRMQNYMYPVLEPLIRRVVKEEVDTALRKYIIGAKRNHAKDTHLPEPMTLQLQFLKAISLPVFSGTRIEEEGCAGLEVALFDVRTGQRSCNGPGSVAKVEIVVLEGDFDGDEGENWTHEEFTSNIVREREGKKPLLMGDVILTLKDGMGLVSDLSFTDNSSWTRSRRFRLGARLIDDVSGVRIREARSEPFVVRDHRGELYKKHHPPSLSDEVWRLEKIGKDGAFHKRLSRESVKTVQDFLILLSLDPTRLRTILGAGMSSKKWKTTVEHARSCVLDKTLYLYNPSTSLQKTGVVFNVVGQVTGVLSEGQYVIADNLSDEEKVDAHKLVMAAFGDRERIILIDESSLNIPTSLEGTYHQESSSHNVGSSTFSQLDVSSPEFMHSMFGDSNSFNYFHAIDQMDLRCDQPLTFPGQVSEPSICDTESMARAFSANEYLKYVEADSSSNLDFGALSTGTEQGKYVEADSSSNLDTFFPCSVPVDKAPKRWNVLVWVLRWRSSIKRIVARKSRVGPIPPYDDSVGKYVP